MKLDKDTFRLEDAGMPRVMALAAGGVGLLGSAAVFAMSKETLFPAYLTSFMFWTTVGLGGLFFILLHHLVGATWSVIIRRIVESIMSNLPIMAILFIPIIIGLPELYEWSTPDKVEEEALRHLLHHKAPYLNAPFFLLRAAIYFGIWTVLGTILRKASLRHDSEPSPELIEKMRKVSGPGMLLFALSLTFAAYDWLMSLDPYWYSTIFGVYIFAGTFLAILAFTTLIVAFLRWQGVLAEEITIEHFHDLGKLMFAFTVFWTYIAFSQYFLIWYANVPEETVWYLHRWEGNWNVVSLFLVAGHFVFPFIYLLSREPKRNIPAMTLISVWILFVHWVDLYWIIMPNFSHHFHVAPKELLAHAATFLGIGGIFVFCFWNRLISRPIVPVNDPKLSASIKFTNA